MRLGTCIALEIVTGLVAVGATSMGTAWAVGELRAAPSRGAPAAAFAPALTPALATAPVPAPLPDAVAAIAPAPLPDPGPATPRIDEPGWSFAGQPDEPLLAPLRTGKVTRVKFNRGGTSLSLRLDFDNGARAAFKPEQTHLHSSPRREIAAYRIDRLLGIGRVPPAIGRTFALADLIAAVDKSQRFATPRLRTEAIARRGQVRGEMSWWIPVLGDMYIGKTRIDSTDAIVQWRRWLKAGAVIPAERRALCEQLSAMTLYDFLVDNTDRWTGNNAKSSADGTVLYFMDNTLAFSRQKNGSHKGRIYLERVQTFSRRLVTRVRELDEAAVRRVLAGEVAPFETLLTEVEIAALLGRRVAALAYVDGLIATHGEDKVLVFP